MYRLRTAPPRGALAMAPDIAGPNRTADPARLDRLIEPGSLLDATPESLLVAQTDGRIVFVNHHAETLTGFSRDELVGELVDRLFTEDLLRSGVGDRVETRCRRRDGHTIPVEVHMGEVEDPQPLLILAIREVAGSMPGHEPTDQAEARYRSLVEQVAAVSYTWTVAGRSVSRDVCEPADRGRARLHRRRVEGRSGGLVRVGASRRPRRSDRAEQALRGDA